MYSRLSLYHPIKKLVPLTNSKRIFRFYFEVMYEPFLFYFFTGISLYYTIFNYFHYWLLEQPIPLDVAIASCSVSEKWQLGFQEPATSVMEGVINFHHDLMFFLIFIVIFVFYMLYIIISKFNMTSNPIPEKFVHGTFIEIIWTCIPALILIIIALPSFSLLYSMDEMIDPVMTIKVIGHQWYWSYEYTDSEIPREPFCFDSYMIPEEKLTFGSMRLLEVCTRVVLPKDAHIRILVTSADVLHSWAIPSLGIKLDACPGRLNQTSLYIKRIGVFYGQCSEICGVNHGFMPIVIETIELKDYINCINYLNWYFTIKRYDPYAVY